jgi:hypothetical protein
VTTLAFALFFGFFASRPALFLFAMPRRYAASVALDHPLVGRY